jgi:hypothetical protein
MRQVYWWVLVLSEWEPRIRFGMWAMAAQMSASICLE